MTENDAKTRWCPMSRMLLTTRATPQSPGRLATLMGRLFRRPAEPAASSVNAFVAVNRTSDATGDPKIVTCIGSQCMMWRGSAKRGWCGLASKPSR